MTTTTSKTMTLALALIMMLMMVSFISRRPPAPSPSHTHNNFRRVFAARRKFLTIARISISVSILIIRIHHHWYTCSTNTSIWYPRRHVVVPKLSLSLSLCLSTRAGWRTPQSIAMTIRTGRRTCIGIDVGTSGVRAASVDARTGALLEQCSVRYADRRSGRARPTTPTTPTRTSQVGEWVDAVAAAVRGLPESDRHDAASICVDATSATAVLVAPAAAVDAGQRGARARSGNSEDGAGEFSDRFVRFRCATEPLMYNEGPADKAAVVAALDALGCPADHTCRAFTSTLCKLLGWREEGLLGGEGGRLKLSHQVDLVNHVLTGEWFTDENNCLKLGYDPDPQVASFPAWLTAEPVTAEALPMRVVAPGQPVAPVLRDVGDALGLSAECVVVGGTTDSIAAFVAAEAGDQMGVGVTSLGSTMAIKMLSETRVDASRFGIYSHRLHGRWLIGGASNSGTVVHRCMHVKRMWYAETGWALVHPRAIC